MRIRGHRYVVDWGHLIFVTLIAAAVLWYLFDARSVSLSVNNLLLVEPIAIAALLMYLLILPQCVRRADAPPAQESPAPTDPLVSTLPKETRALLRIGALGAALGAFVFLLDVIGFDLAIWAFALATMVVCGERRAIPLALYPIAVAVVAVYGFRALMPYPMVTSLL
jgi:Tripartite tricarboxylate transporter TctB family